MPDSSVRFSNPPDLPPPLGYSHIAEVRRGRVLYVAGQTPVDATGALVGKDDFAAQVRQVFSNLKRAVEACGGTFADIVKLNYFCRDSVPAAALPLVREVRDEFVNTRSPPASTFVVVSRLVRPEWLIEIEAVAVIVEEPGA